MKSTTKVIYQIPTNGTMPPYGIHEGFKEFNGCYHSDCYYTMDEKIFGIGNFDAIIFPVPSFRDDMVSGKITSDFRTITIYLNYSKNNIIQQYISYH